MIEDKIIHYFSIYRKMPICWEVLIKKFPLENIQSLYNLGVIESYSFHGYIQLSELFKLLLDKYPNLYYQQLLEFWLDGERIFDLYAK